MHNCFQKQLEVYWTHADWFQCVGVTTVWEETCMLLLSLCPSHDAHLYSKYPSAPLFPLRRNHICTQTRTRHAGLTQMRTNAKKLLVRHSPHKRMSKHSAGYSLTVQMSVRLHQYDCEHIFLWSTDSRRIAFACLPNIRRISEWKGECCSPTRPHYAFCVRFTFAYRCGCGFTMILQSSWSNIAMIAALVLTVVTVDAVPHAGCLRCLSDLVGISCAISVLC